MNDRIKNFLTKLSSNLMARSRSERILVLGMACTGVFMLWLNAVSDPMQESISGLESRISSVTRQIAEQQASYAEKLAASQDDPNRFANDRLQVVTQELEELEGDIAALAGDLVTPAQMTEILTTLLGQQAGLELITFQNEDAVALQSGVNSAAFSIAIWTS